MLRIVKDKVKSLHQPSVEIALPLEARYKRILDAMLQYLKNSQNPEWRERHPRVREGVGLAAPQIGINKCMLAIYYEAGTEEKPEIVSRELVNPIIVEESVRLCYLQGGEGCLSVDEPHPGKVYRKNKIKVKAYEATLGKEVEIEAEGFDAVVLQHEIDHLHGILFYDRIDKLDPDKTIVDAIAI
ncbi:MAG: peptide deformylase [Bacilli bacterium]|jgi:peptide deformylase|nr:peptide deformylase [Bacilli bacterium]